MEILDFIWRSIPMLLQLYADLFLKTDVEKTMIELEAEHNVPITKTYDFIVVGGGSAGCTVASRLSEMFEVLLLDAGGTPPPAANVPFFASLIRPRPLTHLFRSVPQTNASLCCDGVINAPRGNMLGGTSSINAMIHNRGSPKDFDNWANILNDDSFSYMNVLKYFRRMENFVGERFGPEGDDYYGDNGPIVVRTNMVPILPKWFDVARELGYEILDPNGFQREGFMPNNHAIKNGRRSSSYTGYIQPYEESRSTLTVIRYANVSQIPILVLVFAKMLNFNENLPNPCNVKDFAGFGNMLQIRLTNGILPHIVGMTVINEYVFAYIQVQYKERQYLLNERSEWM